LPGRPPATRARGSAPLHAVAKGGDAQERVETVLFLELLPGGRADLEQ
jgi:hypothetical protein